MEYQGKIKIGEKVKVISIVNGHEFNIGEEVFIERIDEDDYKCCSVDGNKKWHLREDEFEVISSDLISSDLISRIRAIEELEGMKGNLEVKRKALSVIRNFTENEKHMIKLGLKMGIDSADLAIGKLKNLK